MEDTPLIIEYVFYKSGLQCIKDYVNTNYMNRILDKRMLIEYEIPENLSYEYVSFDTMRGSVMLKCKFLTYKVDEVITGVLDFESKKFNGLSIVLDIHIPSANIYSDYIVHDNKQYKHNSTITVKITALEYVNRCDIFKGKCVLA